MRALFSALVVGAALAVPLSAPTPAPAATGKTTVDATYEISIAGWGIARATLDFVLQGGRYEASLDMQPKGVAKIVTAVRTTVSAAGEVRRGRRCGRPCRPRARSGAATFSRCATASGRMRSHGRSPST